jgi:hypothetical protein
MRYDHFSMLPEKAFQPRGGFRAGGMTLEGGSSGGGGSPPPQPTATSQVTIPEYAEPYMSRLLGKAEALTESPYQTYGQQRIAGTTAQQEAARQEAAGLGTPGQFGFGTGMIGAGGLGSLGYGAQAAGTGQQYMQMATDPTRTQAFMSPYMQAVTDIQKQSATREAQIAQNQANLASARQGTYGGARQTLAQSERERGLLDRLNQIQAQGSQAAFEAAQKAQQFGSELGLRGIQAGISGAGQAAQAGQAMGQLGAAEQAANLERLKAQEAFGAMTQQQQQAALDMAYQDFLTQQQYPYKQLGFMSDLLRGSANLAGTGGKTVYETPPSMLQQAVGPGLLGLGLYREFMK